MKLIPKPQAGISIIEIIISLLIIGVVLILYQLALNTIFLSGNAKDQEVALRIANNEMENLRSLGYGNLPASGSFTDSLLSSLPSGSGSLTVSAFNSKTQQATVVVSWTEPNSSTAHTVTLTTLITQGGLP